MLAPFFVTSVGRRIFCAAFVPERLDGSRVALLFAAPWAEEMNKSRRMLALLGHHLAESGCAFFLPDLYGTGDSEGDFADARWATWRSNIRDIHDRLLTEGYEHVLLGGLRTGALLASDALSELPCSPSALVYWQPVIDGRQFLTQFLRLRVALKLYGGADRETTSSLRERLTGGECVEVAGYPLAPQMAKALDGLKLADLELPRNIPVGWFNIVSEVVQPSLTPAARALTNVWKSEGIGLKEYSIAGDAFWTTQEIVEVPDLVGSTVDYLGQLRY